jgi:hypothetical protein
LLAANAAMASTPSAANSTVPANANMVGYSVNPNPGPNGAIRSGINGTFYIDGVDAPIPINVRDINNLPVNNSQVVLDFTLCHNLQLCSDQLQLDGQGNPIVVNCAANTVSGYTDINGDLVLSVGGHANNGATTPYNGDTDPNNGLACSGCLKIYADNVDLTPGGPKPVGTYDQDGSFGVGPSDQASFLGDEFGVLTPVPGGYTPRNPDRSDFDASCVVLPSDEALYLQVLFGTLFANVPLSFTNCGTATLPSPDIPHCANAIP